MAKRYSTRTKNKALKLLRAGHKASAVGHELGVPYHAVFDWKKRLLKPAEPKSNGQTVTLRLRGPGMDFKRELDEATMSKVMKAVFAS